MDFYKNFILITLEICFAVFIIIFGYSIWDNFDQTEYNIAKYYDTTKEFDIFLDEEEKYIANIKDEQNIKFTKLYLHNISEERNINELSFKISKDNIYLKNNTIINIDNKYYELNNLEIKEDEYFYYYKIKDIDFNGYETKEFNIKILLKDNVENEYLNYEFVTNI